MNLGFTFAKRQCDWFDLNWKETAEYLNADLFKVIRLGTYWSEIERKRGTYNLDQIKKEIELFSKQEKELIVTVGMKAPRWPEYFVPSWLEKPNSGDVSLDTERNKYVLEFIEKVVSELDQYKNITTWQVENEPINPSAPNESYIPLDFLIKEIDLVKKMSNKKIHVNTWANNLKENNWIEQLDSVNEIDSIGLDLYPMQFDKNKGENRFKFGDYSGPDTTVGDLEKIMNNSKKKFLITELQAEPWEKAFKYKITPEKIRSTSIKKTTNYVKQYSSLPFETIILWGAEYWIWAGIEKHLINVLKANLE